MTLPLGRDRLLDLVVGRGRAGQLDAQAAVAGNGDLGTHFTRRVEGHWAVVLAARQLDLGRGDEVDVVLAHGLREVLRDRVVECLLAGGRDADAGLEHAAGCLAGAESGQPDFLGDLAECLVDVAVELGLVDGHREFDLVSLEGLERTVHRSSRLATRRHRPAGPKSQSGAVQSASAAPT